MSLQSAMQKIVQHVPGRWLAGGERDSLSIKHGAIGQPVSRVDGPLKVAGQARFAAEVQLPNLAYAALVTSTIARGRIAAIGIEAAVAAPGVILVMTHKNAPRMKPPPVLMQKANAAGASSLPIMQDDRVHWNGEPVAVVLAETQEQAERAAALVSVEYEPEIALTEFASAKVRAKTPSSILGEKSVVEIGDAEKELKAAALSLDNLYSTPRHNHNAIELHVATVFWDEDELTIHDATQMLNGTAASVAEVFGLKAEQVHVLSPYVGGGFGGKGLWHHQILAAAASKLAVRPVRLVLSREEVFRLVGGRTNSEQRVALGANRDGTLMALIHTGVVAMPDHANCPEQFSFPARHLYASKSFKLAQKVAHMDMLANTFMRAPGESIGTFALECALDELAEKLQLDPVELRRRLEPEKDPTSGSEFSSRHLVEAYRAGAERFGWAERPPTPRARREGEWLIGMGCATGTYPYYRMPGNAARIRLTADGHAEVATAAHEMGMGTATVHAQEAADRLGLPVDSVSFLYGDTTLPAGSMAGGSSQTASIAAAVIAAHSALVKELLRLAGNDSPLAGLSADEVESRDGGLGSVKEPERYETYTSILNRAGRDEIVSEGSPPPPLEGMKYSMHSTCAQFCEVRVSEITGEVRVTRFLGSFDCGRILNPKTAASQFRGGIIMGLGLALMEETLFDERNGRVANASMAEYHVPVHLDVPKIDVIWTDLPDPRAPLGARGIGEIGITGVGAAVANAIYNATGRRIRQLPITLDKLL